MLPGVRHGQYRGVFQAPFGGNRIEARFESQLEGRASAMRRNLTVSQSTLWLHLAGKRLGVAFRRQVPLDRYVVDFLAPSVRLIPRKWLHTLCARDDFALDPASSKDEIANDTVRVFQSCGRQPMGCLLLNGSDYDIALLNEPVDALLRLVIVVDHGCHVDIASRSRFAVC